jgi:hypothetical protein
MSTPEIAFQRFLTGLALGCLLGVVYGFLRPVRRGKAILPDLVFAFFTGWGYLYYGFAVCRGDLRMAYFAAPILGAIVWDRSIGRWLRPIYDGFWKCIGKILGPFRKIMKKTWIFVKFLFASGKKWVTIKCTNRKHPEKGVRNEKQPL